MIKQILGRPGLKWHLTALAMFFVLLSSQQSLAEEPAVMEIIEKSNLAAVYPGNDGRAETRMMIVDKQGRKQIRQFTILRVNTEPGGLQKYLVVFSRPSDVARTVFLVEKHPGSDDDRWLYLPGLDLVKRIAAGDKRTSFVGSTFFYEDISGRDIYQDEFEMIGQDENSWLIKAVPKQQTGNEFSYYQVTISKQNYLPLKAEYFDENGELYRRVSAGQIETIQGIPTMVSQKAENLRDGSYTINQMRNIEYNIDIPDIVFSERSLRTPPRKWLEFGK